MTHRLSIGGAASLALPLAALALVGAAIVVLSNIGEQHTWTHEPAASIQTVRVPRGQFVYEQPGEFTLEGHRVDAPVERTFVRGALEVMKYQVSAADYAQCVSDGACAAPDSTGPVRLDLPVTGVSYNDAVAYADWLSAVTGETWRLPTDRESAYFRNAESAPPTATPSGSFADTWLAEYRNKASQPREAQNAISPFGTFGENPFGVADTMSNVWEWTSTCYTRVRLDAGSSEVSRVENCGVRVLQGQHRAYISAFIRDAVAGACAIGLPPDHLGFRLVRERHWYDPLVRWAGRGLRLIA